MSAPLYEHLLAYSKQNRISFAMPGHKNGRGLKKDLLSLDVTELSETENLIHPGEYVLKAQELLSSLYGSDKSYILTGGSKTANQSINCSKVKAGGPPPFGGGRQFEGYKNFGFSRVHFKIVSARNIHEF